jgi:O-antigen ligase
VSRIKFSRQGQFIIAGLILVTILITPLTSFDPFNVSKFVAITVFGFGLFGLIIGGFRIRQLLQVNKVLSVLVAIFFLQSFLILLLSPTPLLIQLFGGDGRNTGFVFYLSLVFIFMGTYFFSDTNLKVNIIRGLIFAGLLNTVYGIFQSLGIDFFKWTNLFSPVFGFFGNPNFLSAFLGIVSSAMFPFLFDNNKSVKFRFIFLLVLFCNFYVIFSTKSIQGVIIFLFGFLLCLYIFVLKSNKLKKFSIVFALSFLTLVILTICDVFQKVPWNPVVYKESVSYRGDLWRAALNMSSDFPITGVGFDGFGLFYRNYRDSIAVEERGIATVADSAHNVLLDVLTNGGIPLLIIYCGFIFLVLRSVLIVLKESKEFDPFFASLVVSWSTYQMQSLISINQIGVAIWGWALGGVILGYRKSMDINVSVVKTDRFKNRWQVVSFFIGIFSGLLVSIPVYTADSNFRTAIDSKQIKLVLDSAYEWPQSPQRMYRVASLFYANDLNELVRQVSGDAVLKFPRSYENWELLSKIEEVPLVEQQEIFRNLSLLDPAIKIIE